MQNFICTLLICSVTMSALSILFMLLSPLLSKRYGAKWQYYAWLVIIVGFIVPFRPNFNFNIFTVPVYAPLVQNEITYIPVHEDISTAKTSMNIPEKDIKNNPGLSMQESISNTPVNNGTADIFESDNGEESTAGTFPNNSDILQGEVKPNHILKLSAYEISIIVFIIWIIGVMIMLGYNLFRHRRLMKTVNRWKDDISDARTLDILQKQKEMLGIRKDVSIHLYPLIAGSMLAELMKPSILLQTTQYSDEELSFIIRHELIHFKHKDLFFKILVLTAKAIHWFNPVVYLTARAVSVQCEKACDEAVIGNADTAVRKRYALFIADISKVRSDIQTALTTNFYGGKYNMKTRLLSIIDRSKKKKGIILICFTLILTICTSLVIAANANEKDILNDDISIEDDNPILSDDINDDKSSNIYSIDENKEEIDNINNQYSQYSIYSQYGISYDEETDELFYNGQRIRYFCDYAIFYNGDDTISGSMTIYSPEEDYGDIDVYAVRNSKRELLGVIIAAQYEFDSRTLSADSMNQAIAPYKKFGLSANNVGRMYFEGLPVRELYDTVTGEFITENVGAGHPAGTIDVIPVYSNGTLTGLRKSTQEEYDAVTQRRINDVQDFWVQEQQKQEQKTEGSHGY